MRRSRALMGTIFEIMVVGRESRATEEAIAGAFDEVARLEEMMSEWRPASQISKVNAAAGWSAVRVDAELMLVIQEGLRIARLSDGAFDISWAALRGLWNFNADDPRPPTRAAARAAAKLVNWRDVIVDERARTVMLKRPGMAIGLGGIAKGYALDRAAEVLKARGLHDFIIYGGGQVLVSGQKGGRPWRVGIQHPRRRDVYFAYFSPGAGSVSTSGDYEHYFVKDTVRYHHILDPTTGFPANASVAVTVVSPTGLAADAIDTALFILGPTKGMQLARRLGIEALFIDPAMRVTMTDGFRRDLTMMPLDD
ncbi:MAG: FAD:protein FMN transferase [Deltaproteobacteria bacterium]|nr:FAD:protein FMN transferase [Deltaproteobacteria bacterium]